MTNMYRGIEFTLWNNNFIRLFDQNGIKKDGRDYLRRGELYVSIPKHWMHRPDIYAKRQIDILFERLSYHENHELRGKLK